MTPQDGGMHVVLSGDLTVYSVSELARQTETIPEGAVTVDLAGVGRIDTAGAWMLARLHQRMTEAGAQMHLAGARDEVMALLTSVTKSMPAPEPAEAAPPTSLLDRVAALGKRVAGSVGYLGGLLGYLGMFLSRLMRTLRHPREFGLTPLVHHCEEVGVKAVPIVALMAFLIGVVLAFQGASQLQQFGAEVFVVDLIAISILRELGILLTAIIVAGRTASSFTAAIGSMKMREEIDAMRTLGLDPVMLLFVPRILALLITLPILGIIANLSGLLGGALMSWVELGISPEMFRIRLMEGTDISHLTVGVIKAPFFAVIIGLVGCHAGMQVKGNAESLGRMTSSAVVTAIFAVIVTDAAFSIFFAQMGM
ncbi:ABC transporter permease [Dinoroseobacter sp. S124A]|uniref:ABC transporter permease n=1 Tax=Dinoroseobacter sp. S124A TaxID=3415128 RepID=UPI003C7ECBD8